MKLEKIKNLQWTYWAIILALIVIGLILIIISQIITHELLKATLSNLASAVIVSGIFSAVNEKILKSNLIELILSKLNLKKEIDETGIENVYTNISDIDYMYYLKNAKKNIDILHVYGRTWTTNNLDEIKDKLLNSNCNIRVILVAPDSPFIEGLANHYHITPEELKLRIKEVTDMWKSICIKKTQRKRKKTQSSIKLYYHYGQPSSALYRIDDRIINVQNKLSGERSKRLTTIVCKNTKNSNDIYNNFLNEIEELIKISKEVELNQNQ